MRYPELIEETTAEELPKTVRKLLFLSALASVALSGLALFLSLPGLEELLGHKRDPWGELDRTITLIGGLPAALAGLFAAWQGWDGSPKTPSRVLAATGAAMNLALLAGVGLPFLSAYLKTV